MSALAPLDVGRVPLDGVTLIEASAGTGKTHTIATLFVRLLLEKDLEVSEILVVTYTRAATAELRQRIRARLGAALDLFDAVARESADLAAASMLGAADPVLLALARRTAERSQLPAQRLRLLQAIRSFDQAAIFTIHGFCQRVLSVSAFESGAAFDAELLEDQRSILNEVVQDYWVSKLHAADETFVRHALEHAPLRLLTGLAQRACADPELQVIPTVVPQPVVPLQAAFDAARQHASEVFTRTRAEIAALLTQDDRLKRPTYAQEKILQQWLPEFARLSSYCASALPDSVARVATSALAPGKGTKVRREPPQHAFFDACEQLIQARDALTQALDHNLLAFQQELVAYARAELARRKQERGALGFDDLLQRLRAAVQGPSGPALLARLRQLHPAALIDEFQDTDPIQCTIFQRIYDPSAARGSALFLIGDPKQAIYGFRGADVFAYMAAAKVAGTRAYTLAVNWRSDPSLVRAINTLFARARAPFLFPEIRFHEVAPRPNARDCLGGSLQGAAALELCLVQRTPDANGKPSKLTKTFGGDRLCQLVAQQIVAALNQGASITEDDGRSTPLSPRHIAVLCRSNLQARTMQQALRELGVPTVLDGDDSVFGSDTAAELDRLLWAMAEPGDFRRVRAALTTSLVGESGDDLLALDDESEDRWDLWLTRFHAWHELWETRGFIQALHAALDQLAVPARLLSLPDGERRLTDLLHLSELLHAQSMSARLGPLALLDWLQRMRADAAERVAVAESAQIRLESDARALTLTTIHKSKGLEYPVVYCPFLWDGALLRGLDAGALVRFHEHDGGGMTLDLQAAQHKDQPHYQRAEREALAENLRLLYVALTRAKHRLSVVWGNFTETDKSALGYLLHQAGAADDAVRDTADDVSLASATRSRIKDLTDAELQADLAALAADSGGTISISRLVAREGVRYVPSSEIERPLRARVAQRMTRDLLRTSSFSRLSAGQMELAQATVDEGLDRDEADAGSPATDAAEGVAPASQRAIALATFPAGVTPGHLIHEIYETIDFRQTSVAACSAHVESLVLRYGLDAAWAPPLCEAIVASLVTPIAAAGGLPSLSVLAPGDRLAELEFVFPVASSKAPATSWLNASALAAVLGQHARDAAERSYAQRVGKLGFAPLAGFLRGFMDLVARHEGRYYLLDYKSNHLGEQPRDYAASRLHAVMTRHHYVLQYLLYSVALHRHLRLRVPGYDYEQHFGGVYYLFVRGMAPEHPVGTGVFADRPSRALVEALSALLGEPAGEP